MLWRWSAPARKGNQEYWIIKNSWGADAHDDGFFYMLKGQCAIDMANDTSYPAPAASKGQTPETLALARLVATSLSSRSASSDHS